MNTSHRFSGMDLQLRRWLWLIVAALFAYVFYRAATLSFTHDESLSYTILQGVDVYTRTANHHWLNTVLMEACSHLFGDAEWSLRLPNVLAFGVYAVSVMGILKLCKHAWIQLIGAALLLGNPLLIEFFSLARGYGLSIGWMMAALYFLLAPKPSARRFLIHALLGLVCMSIAIGAGLAVINVYIMFIGLFGLKAWQERSALKFSHRQVFTLLFLLLLSAVPLLLAIQRLLFLKEHNELYFGTDNLFFTLESLVEPSVRNNGELTRVGWSYVVIGLSALVLMDLILLRRFKGWLMTSVLLLGGVLTGAILERSLFDAFYAIERAALYLVPLFGLVFFFALSDWYEGEQRPGVWKYVAGITVVALTAWNFVDTTQAGRTHTWQYDRNTKEAVLLMDRLCKDAEPCSIGNFWLHKPAMNYYISSRQLHLQPARDNSDGRPYLVYQYRKGFRDKGYRMVKYYPDTGTAIYVRTTPN